MYWTDWPLERMLILFVSVAFILIFIQVTLYHYRQNFHQKVMWVPVVSAPVFVIAGLILTWCNVGWLRYTFLILMWFGVVFGLVGFYYHLRGVAKRVDGYTLRNFMIGPPVTLPVVFAAMSGLGLIALYWKGI